MRKAFSGELLRGLVAFAFVCGVFVPVSGVTAAGARTPGPDARAARLVDAHERRSLLASPFVDDAAKLSIRPPAGWVRAPQTSLNPLGEPVLELARFQIRTVDASLYEQPVPLTSGLVLDAGAVISVGLARVGSETFDLQLETRAERESAGSIPGFLVIEDESEYEGLHELVQYFLARGTDRRLVARAVASQEEWDAIGPLVRASLASLRADQDGPSGPEATLPEPPQQAVAATAAEDPSARLRNEILARASLMLGTPYLWGGNNSRGMDCSAYVSAAWTVSRYTTDSIWAVSHPITKGELLPGDAMNLTIGRDPRRAGHIRVFEAWANAARTVMWVYEETPPRAVHRAIAYDPRYQPIRRSGLSGAGEAPLVIAPPAAIVSVADSARAPAPQARRAPAARATPKPASKRTWQPSTDWQKWWQARGAAVPTLRPRTEPTPRPVQPVATPRPAATARPTARPTTAPRAVPTLRPTKPSR